MRQDDGPTLDAPTAEKLRELFAFFLQAPAPICVLRGPDLIFEMANAAFEQLAGRVSLVGRRMLDVLPELRGQGYGDLLARSMRTRDPDSACEQLVRLHRRGGGEPKTTFWTFNCAPLTFDDGVPRIMVFCSEVSEQVRAREDANRALRRAEEASARLQMAMELADLGTWELDLRTGEERWSERTRQIFAMPPEAAQTYEFFLSRIHPDDLEPVQQTIGRSAAPGGPDRFRVEYRIVLPGGEQRWVRSNGRVATREPDGSARHLAGIAADVTEMKRAERESSVRETIAQNATLALLMMDHRQHCTYMNSAAERMTGYTLAEVQGRTLHDFVHWKRPDGSPYPIADCPVYRALPERRQMRGEEMFVRRDGSFYPVAFTASPLFQGGVPVGTVVEVRDLTEEKRAERERADLLHREQAARAQAESANRAKDEFLAMLGHELRNPLSPILTAVEVMRLDAHDAFKRERTVIKRQVDHLVRLVDDLLDVSRITRGKVELRRRVTELSGILAKAVEQASPMLEQRAQKLDLRVPREGLRVNADEVRLAQVIANLLNNASKYSGPGSRITVTGQAEGGDVVLAVRDQGVGMSPELLARVFDLFVQGDRTIDRSEGGLGLGLPIVRSIVQLHGGRVEARSEGRGHGSEFVIRLPAAGAAPVGIAHASADAPAPRPSHPRRVLVVDDNRDAAEMLAEVLQIAGHEVATAFDGPQALQVAAGFLPDVALLDIGLPVMDGYELARRLAASRGPSLRLIAVTGYGQSNDRRRSADAGFSAHLVKPVDLDLLTSLLEAAD